MEISKIADLQAQESLDKAILLNAAFRYGMEREGICISFTIVKTAFMVWKGHLLQKDKRAGAQAPLMSMCARAWSG